MTLASGTRLGPFEVISLLGAGGMGEVLEPLVEAWKVPSGEMRS